MANLATKKHRKPTNNKGSALQTIIGWIFIVVAIAAIVAIIKSLPQQRGLVCDNTGTAVSLTHFGTCHEE